MENGITCYTLLYVDDVLIFCNDEQKIRVIKKLFMNQFEMTDIGKADTFLGMHIEQTIEDGEIIISQKQYLENVLNKFGMDDCKGVNTPMDAGLNLEKGNPNNLPNVPYRELMGCLTYATLTTRPDLCAATIYFSRFQSCYTVEHFTHAKRILRYIKQTLNIKMVYQKSLDAELIVGYTDADMKHIDIKYNFIRESIAAGEVLNKKYFIINRHCDLPLFILVFR